MIKAPTGQIALVFANVQGATGLWDRVSGPMTKASTLYNEILRKGLDACMGYEVKSEGDIFMVAFSYAMDAVSWCLKVQEELVHAPWPQGIIDEPFGAEIATEEGQLLFRGLRVRMGIHVGEPSCKEDPVTGRMDYFGPMVNRTARIANAAHGGQILLSAEVLQSDDRLETIHCVDLGVYRLRGVKESGRLFQVQPSTLSERDFPPLRALGEHKSNLPHQPNVFVGRQKALYELSHIFNEGHDIVTLVGPGGIGKSRLAIKFGSLQLIHYPGGVWYADVSVAHSLGDFLQALAKSFSMTLTDIGAEKDQIDILGDAIKDYGRVLLIIDNFEYLTKIAEETVDVWARQAPYAHFLLTSRVKLGLLEETLCPLRPMDEEDGVMLFEHFAKSRSYGFKLNQNNKDAVREIVQRLDGVPLALELAASRINILTPANILDRLSSRFQLLQNRDAQVEKRQRTLKATIDWSWEMLEPWEKSVLAQSAVFRGGFDLKAANAVIDLSSFDKPPSISQIARRLVEMHLWKEENLWQGYARFSMFESIRDYAEMKLKNENRNDKGDSFMVQQRHAAFYAQFGDQAHLDSFSMKGGMRRRQKLMLELENLHQAIQFTLSEGKPNQSVLFALAAMHIYAEQGPFLKAIELAAEMLKQNALASHSLIRVLMVQARASRYVEHSLRAKEILEKALLMAEETGDEINEGVILTHLGEVNKHLGDLDLAEKNYRRALLLHRKNRNRLQEGMTLGLLGINFRFHNHLEKKERFQEAQQYFKDALKIHQQIGNRAAEGWVHRVLGDLLIEHDFREEGHQNYQASLSILQEVGHRFDEAITLGKMGRYYLQELRLDDARIHLENCILLCKKLQIKTTGYFMCALGEVLARMGEMEEAAGLVKTGEAIVREKEADNRLLGLVLCNRGQICRMKGEIEAAKKTLKEAQTLLSQMPKGSQLELNQSISQLQEELGVE